MQEQRTTIVNVKNSRCDIYCGRPSIFSNPYKIGRDGTRNEVIEKYKNFFEKKIRGDETFREKILSLKGKKLGCYCYPLRCHLEVIVKYLDGDMLKLEEFKNGDIIYYEDIIYGKGEGRIAGIFKEETSEKEFCIIYPKIHPENLKYMCFVTELKNVMNTPF